MEITRLRGWYDPGFTESGNERPSASYVMPAADYDKSVSLHPPIGRLFTELRLDESWLDWRDISYIEITVGWNNELASTVLKGFVDSVDVLSDTGGAMVTSVKWHVDEWGTYISNASLGAGHVLRRPVGTDDPIQSYERKFWAVDSTTTLIELSSIISTKDTWWVLLAAGIDDGAGNTRIQYYSYPIATDASTAYGQESGTSNVGQFVTLFETLSGMWDESLGIDPQSVYGVWILPYAPMGESYWSGAGTAANPITAPLLGAWNIEQGPHTTVYFKSVVPDDYADLFTQVSVSISATSSELNPVHVTGFDGESLGELPIGFTVSSATYHTVVSATECYIEIRFDGLASRLEGLCFTVPAIPLDMSENAWSSYQYSGQRDYDIEARNIQSIKSGVESMTSGGASGAILGGLGPIGALAGAVTGAMGGAASLAMDFGWGNAAEQRNRDKLAASQSPGILISGAALGIITYGRTISLVTLEMDSYSAGRAVGERSQIGVAVDEYETSVTLSTGFYQIANLVVGGSIPNSAKAHISRLFAQGVRII
jgi:hypothetical protein